MNDSAPQRRRRKALAAGGVAFLATSFTVSHLTPDGNLVVTIVPGLVIGLIVYGISSWLSRS